MPKLPIEASIHLDDEYDNAIFKSQDHFKNEISRLCYGDLYVIGRLWIRALSSVLVGANLSLFPTIKAAAKLEPPIPPRPPKMKYKDLPIYESPHYEYKDYMEDQKKCPKADVKILQTYLYPKVKSYRKSWSDSIAEFNKDAREMKNDACAVACKKKKEFISFMRCPNNYVVRQAVVATGIVTGFYVGRGGGALKKIFCTTVGVLSTGALCFPDETDEIFRNASFRVGKFAVTAFNSFCGMNYSLRERVPCRDDMPPPPPNRPPEQKNKCDDLKKK